MKYTKINSQKCLCKVVAPVNTWETFLKRLIEVGLEKILHLAKIRKSNPGNTIVLLFANMCLSKSSYLEILTMISKSKLLQSQ